MGRFLVAGACPHLERSPLAVGAAFRIRQRGFQLLHGRPPPFPLMPTPPAGTWATRRPGSADEAGGEAFIRAMPPFKLTQAEAATFGKGTAIYHFRIASISLFAERAVPNHWRPSLSQLQGFRISFSCGGSCPLERATRTRRRHALADRRLSCLSEMAVVQPPAGCFFRERLMGSTSVKRAAWRRARPTASVKGSIGSGQIAGRLEVVILPGTRRGP